MDSKTSNRNDQLYIAYGSNLNLDQMAKRCPTAEIVGVSVLHGFCLRFRGSQGCAVATVEQANGSQVPVLVWRLQPQDEAALDRYEGWPHLYRKETLQITVNGKKVSAMIYIMNEQRYPYGAPSDHYLNTVLEGYKAAGFDTVPLIEEAKEETGDTENDRND